MQYRTKSSDLVSFFFFSRFRVLFIILFWKKKKRIASNMNRKFPDQPNRKDDWIWQPGSIFDRTDSPRYIYTLPSSLANHSAHISFFRGSALELSKIFILAEEFRSLFLNFCKKISSPFTKFDFWVPFFLVFLGEFVFDLIVGAPPFDLFFSLGM